MTEPEQIDTVKTEIARLIDDIDVLKFKLANVTTEKDVAREEIARLVGGNPDSMAIELKSKDAKIAKLERDLSKAIAELLR